MDALPVIVFVIVTVIVGAPGVAPAVPRTTRPGSDRSLGLTPTQ